MSGSDVLTACATYLQRGVGTIPHLSDVFENPPKFTNKSAFYDGPVPGNTSGALIWLWLGPQYARRIDLQGAAPGGKMYYYDLHLQCVMLCSADLAETADADNRDFLDGLTSWIDADKKANSTVVFQWGEGKFPNGEDLNFEPGWPMGMNNGVTHVYTKGTVAVCEYHGAGQ